MKRILIILTAVLFSFSSVSGQELSNVQAAFLDIGFGARPMAMGGAYTALADNAYGLSWNPAGIAWQPGMHSLAFSSVKLLGLINYNHFGYSFRADRGFGAGTMVVTSGDDLMSESTIYLSGVANGKMIQSLTFLHNLSLGFNVKYFTTSYGNNADGAYVDGNGLNHQVKGSASGFGLDLGLNYKVTPRDRIGLFYRNPVNSISWSSNNEVGTAQGDYEEGLPAELILGYARLNDNIIFALDYNKSLYEDVEDMIHTGLEFPLLRRFFKKYVLLRAGYSQELLTGENRIYSFGGGTRVELFNGTFFAFDIAYQIQTLWEGHDHLRLSFNILR